MEADATNPPAPLDEHLCYAIYSAGIAIQRLYKPMLDELGITYPQYLVLSVLWTKGESSVGELAQSLALESSTITPLLKRLETGGLVTRERNPENERRVIVSLTDQGRSLRNKGGCLGDALLKSSRQSASELSELTTSVRHLREQVYRSVPEWADPV